jgi:hypothetical protein
MVLRSPDLGYMGYSTHRDIRRCFARRFIQGYIVRVPWRRACHRDPGTISLFILGWSPRRELYLRSL